MLWDRYDCGNDKLSPKPARGRSQKLTYMS